MNVKQLDIMDYLSTQTMIHGDCLEKMREMTDNSIDFIVCDPPYGLNFMGKKWDDNVPNINIWMEALRICKPGSMLAAFGGSRTHHHLMNALEKSGWEIRDVIMWLYGSGFPKSHNKFGLQGYGTALKPAYEPIIIAMKPIDGTYKQNAEKWGVGGINIAHSRIGITPAFIDRSRGPKSELISQLDGQGSLSTGGNGRWPSNLILSEEAAEQLDQMTGISKSVRSKGRNGNNLDSYINVCAPRKEDKERGHNDSGGASRFFYCAKASSSERNKGLEGMPLKENCFGKDSLKGITDLRMDKEQKRLPKQNNHPTVKPISLMKYILKLLAPPSNPICLDPFAGSGSTLLAAKELGINCIGIEKELEYFEIAINRLQ